MSEKQKQSQETIKSLQKDQEQKEIEWKEKQNQHLKEQEHLVKQKDKEPI